MAAKLEPSRQIRARRLGHLVTQQWFKFAQRLSQALLIPIAILPAAGVMLVPMQPALLMVLPCQKVPLFWVVMTPLPVQPCLSVIQLPWFWNT